MTFIPISRLLSEGRSDDHPVALQRGELRRFGDFRVRVASAAARFKGCRSAALACQDSYNFAVGFFGLLHAGVKIVLLPNSQPETQLALKAEFDVLVDDVMIKGSNGASAALMPLDPARLCLGFFTSGSTGTPKQILKNLAMLESEIAMLDALWGQDLGQGPVFTTVSHQHIYGLTFKLLWPLMAGRPFAAEMHVLWESLLSELVADAVIVSSPAHLGRLDGIDPLPPRQNPRRIFSAGAVLSWKASRQTEAVFGCRPTEIFGSTETGAFATRSQTGDDEPWKLLPGINMRCDSDGHLVLRSPFVGPDWLITADLIEPLAEGFRFLGRADRIVKIEGKRISLAEVEAAVTRLPFVKAAAVAMLRGELDRLAAVVVPNEKGRAKLDEIGSFRFGRFLRGELAAILEAAGSPRLWRFVDELPVQGLGKQRDADICALFDEDA